MGKLLADIRLWNHQREALEMARDYLRHRLEQAALIRMPTGTGKSGIIAALARCFKDTPTVLVLTPWVHLRKQLANDVHQRFWSRIGANPSLWPKPVYQFTPSSAKMVIDKTSRDSAVLACTIQTIQALYREGSPQYDRLKRKAALVIVDEGHREPAPEWAEAARGMGRPTILFTATPYRNDHKIFNVDPKYVYVFSHHRAVEERYPKCGIS